jgi:Ala-tRNA(Pro) deacylase
MVDIFEFLTKHGIVYERHDHPPVFTCEEAERLVPPVAGAKTKNLFLRDKKGRRHFLILVGYDKTVDLRGMASVLGLNRLTLASPERLRKYLGVDPGAVTILGVANDAEGGVEVIIDEDLWSSEAFRCHPLVNTSTLVISKEGLERFLDVTGHQPRIIEIPGQD